MKENSGKSHLPQLMALFESLPLSQKNAALRQMQEGISSAHRDQPGEDIHSCEFCEDFVMSSSSEKIHDVVMNPFAEYHIDVRDPSKILTTQESITTFHSKTKHHNSVTLTRALSRRCLLCQWIFELLGQSLADFKAALQTHHISVHYRNPPTRSPNFSQDDPINDLDYIDQTRGLYAWIKFSTFGAVKGVLGISYRPEPELLDRLCAMLPNSEKNEKSYSEYEMMYIRSPSMAFTGYTTAESPAAKWVMSRPPLLALPAQDSFRLARQWLEECVGHQDCPKAIGALPSRVIDIGTQCPARTVKLRWTEEGELGQYVALSYCWGGKQSLLTTKLTAQDFTDGIPVSKLPRTIKDAITVTQELGLRFVWVDALCIIQDDPEDVAREVDNMAHVYREAYITLSAACSRSVNDGFLSRQRVNPVSSFKIPLLHEGHESGTIYIHKPETYSHTEDPIHVRAWTLQEHALSRRTLTYSTQGIWFNCHTNNHFDREHVFKDVPIPRSLRSKYHIDTLNIDSWRDLVHTYTRRFLSLPSDKLPAIAGIAAHFRNDIGGAYLAGLWEKHLPSELMWCSTRADITRPLDARAPSWSWAAVDGEVHYRWCKEGKTTGSRGLEILGFHVELRSSASAFGEVDPSKCMLRVRGHVAELEWDADRKRLYTVEGRTDYRAMGADVGRTQADALEVNTQRRCTDVWALIVQEEPCRGLVLARIAGDKFRRVGIFYRFWEPDGSFFERRTITIV